VVSWRMRPERNERSTSGPVARCARWYGITVSLAVSMRRGLRTIAATVASSSSIRERRNSKRAIAGGRPPAPRATDLRNPLSEKRANVSLRISHTMVSKCSRVSFRRSGSMMISKRRSVYMRRGRVLIVANHPSLIETFFIPLVFWPWAMFRLRMFPWSLPDKNLFKSFTPEHHERLRCIRVGRDDTLESRRLN